MKKAVIFLSAVIVVLLVLPADHRDVRAAAPQDVMAGYWVLKFDDGRTGWANLVSDDYTNGWGIREYYEKQARNSNIEILSKVILKLTHDCVRAYHTIILCLLGFAKKALTRRSSLGLLSQDDVEKIVDFLKTTTGAQPAIEYPILPLASKDTPLPKLD